MSKRFRPLHSFLPKAREWKYRRKLRRLKSLEESLAWMIWPTFRKENAPLLASINDLYSGGMVDVKLFLGELSDDPHPGQDEALEVAFMRSVKPDVITRRMLQALAELQKLKYGEEINATGKEGSR